MAVTVVAVAVFICGRWNCSFPPCISFTLFCILSVLFLAGSFGKREFSMVLIVWYGLLHVVQWHALRFHSSSSSSRFFLFSISCTNTQTSLLNILVNVEKLYAFGLVKHTALELQQPPSDERYLIFLICSKNSHP